MQVATGTYVGTGASLDITGLGFTPVFVLTRDVTSLAGSTVYKSGAFISNGSTEWDQFGGAEITNGIIAFLADGFRVLNKLGANASGNTHHWIAFGADALAIESVRFTSDGTDNRLITTTFQADLIWGGLITGGGNDQSLWFDSEATQDASYRIQRAVEPIADMYQDANPTSIEVGTLNNIGVRIHAFTIFKKAASNIDQGSYVGDGTSSNPITGLGFAPDAVWIARQENPGSFIVYRQNTLVGDATFLIASSGSQTNMIKSLDGDGFTLGSANEVNKSGITYHYFAVANLAPGTPFDRVLPLHYKSGLEVDRIVPLQYTSDFTADRLIPVLYDIDNTLRAGRQIPLQYGLTVRGERVVPIEFRGQPATDFDRALPLQYGTELNVDRTIPVDYRTQEPWIPDPASQPDAFTPEGASEADAWTPDGPSETDAWTPS